MRWLPVLVLLCACENTNQRDETGHPAAESPHRGGDDATLPQGSLDRRGELHVMLVDEHGTPRCDRWVNDPGTRELGIELRGEQIKLRYERTDADTLVVNAIVRASAPVPLGCHWELGARGGTRWFRSAAECATAIANHEQVATLLPCRLANAAAAVAQADRDASRKRFESLLRHGGTMYLFGESDLIGCTAVTITSRRKKRIEGSFSLRYTTMMPTAAVERGLVNYGFTWTPGADTMFVHGPEYTPDTDSEAAYARMCGSATRLGALATGIQLNEPGTLYFTEAGCRDGLAKYEARARWLAAKEPTTWQCGDQ